MWGYRFAAGFIALLVSGGVNGASAYKVVKVKTGGTITGKVVLKGKPLPPKSFKVEKTPEVCGKEDRILKEVRIDASAGLADVVLVLEGVKKGKPYAAKVSIEGPPPGTRKQIGESNVFPGTTIRPKKCLFGAFTGVVANGKLLRFANQDSVKHSPHTYRVKGRVRKTMFNQDLEGNSKLDVKVKFKKKKTKVMKLECDQHNHMQNWFYRVDSPYYAFSGDDGSFKIDNIPPGKYRLIAWHPKFKKIMKKRLTVKPDGTVKADFKFVSKVR